MARSKEDLMEFRKQMISQMEQELHESWPSEEDSLFYYHFAEELNPCILKTILRPDGSDQRS